MNSALNPKYSLVESRPDALEDIAGSIAAGEPMWEVSRRYGLSQGQLGYWLTVDGERALRYAAALRACSHSMVMEGRQRVGQAIALADRGTRLASGATEDTAGVVKLEVDACIKSAGIRLKAAEFNVGLAGVVNPGVYGKVVDGGPVLGALTAVLREISERKRLERIGGERVVSEQGGQAVTQEEGDI